MDNSVRVERRGPVASGTLLTKWTYSFSLFTTTSLPSSE